MISSDSCDLLLAATCSPHPKCTKMQQLNLLFAVLSPNKHTMANREKTGFSRRSGVPGEPSQMTDVNGDC